MDQTEVPERFGRVAAACRVRAAQLRADAAIAQATGDRREGFRLRRRAARLMADAAAAESIARDWQAGEVAAQGEAIARGDA